MMNLMMMLSMMRLKILNLMMKMLKLELMKNREEESKEPIQMQAKFLDFLSVVYKDLLMELKLRANKIMVQ
jgi:hypothetical protein